MSWGCADVACSTMQQHVPSHETIGYSVVLFRRTGYRITIYAEKFCDTTSDVAGGQWAPAVVEYDEKDAASKRRFEEILRTSFKMHSQNIGPAYGVSQRTNYTLRLSPSFGKVPTDIIPAPTCFRRLPFTRLNRPGFREQAALRTPRRSECYMPRALLKIAHDRVVVSGS
jgi:hypothetical protein